MLKEIFKIKNEINYFLFNLIINYNHQLNY